MGAMVVWSEVNVDEGAIGIESQERSDGSGEKSATEELVRTME